MTGHAVSCITINIFQQSGLNSSGIPFQASFFSFSMSTISPEYRHSEILSVADLRGDLRVSSERKGQEGDCDCVCNCDCVCACGCACVCACGCACGSRKPFGEDGRLILGLLIPSVLLFRLLSTGLAVSSM